MLKIRGAYSRHVSWLYLFLGGFLIGTFAVNIWGDFFLEGSDLLSAASLSRLRYLDIDGNAFLLFVLKERLGMVLMLCLLATTYAGILAVSGYALCMGTMAGIFLSAASIRYGLKGILLVLAGILPQYLLLAPAFLMLMNWCWRVCTALHYPHRSGEMVYGGGKQYLLRKLPQLVVIIGIIFIVSVLESYVNPVLLSNFLKIF